LGLEDGELREKDAAPYDGLKEGDLVLFD